MSESSAELTEAEKLQHEIEMVWKDELHWQEGSQIKIDGLPEGTRLIEVDPDTLVLRSLIPNAPENPDQEKPNDVPVAVYGAKADPKELKREALKVGSAIIRGDVKIDKAARPLPPQNTQR